MHPTLAELTTSARVVSLPLTTRFRGITEREIMLFEGPEGWTEFSPFAEYGDTEASVWLAAAIDFGWSATPELHRATVGINATLPAVPAADVPAVLALFPGCRTVKVKVAEPGQTLVDDTARVSAARRVLGAEGRIRIDANGAWSIDAAERAIHKLAEYDLEYVEQPCATVAELARLRARIAYMDVPIAADESVRKAEDPLGVVRAGGADLLIVKAAPLGGIRRTLELAASAGVPAVVSSALESSVGISMGLHLAAALPALDFDCGLGTAALLGADVTRDPLLAVNGQLVVRRVIPDIALLDEHAAASDRAEWWMSRLERCYQLL
ncbi:MAG: o-succinylbenzoate synthase [Salinibacterium sp.]|nr:o-succinylbenzoate synthase [Salinibacterium sp.]